MTPTTTLTALGLLAVLCGPSATADTAATQATESNHGDWCEWLTSNPGELYRDKENPWIQKVELYGRLDYQVARVEGTDINSRSFRDTYDEWRRARLGIELDFLNYFSLEAAAELVSDNRFRDDVNRELDWGYDRFHEAVLEFDATDAFDIKAVDNLDIAYGRSRLRMGYEGHQSSGNILTIERSAISEKLGGDLSRPTGLTVEVDKGDWELTVGIFSADDDADFLADWTDGVFHYASLRWDASEQLTFIADYAHNDNKGMQDALGYAWASTLSAEYDAGRWGVAASVIMGENQDGMNNPELRRQGDFHSYLIMPWLWVIEDRLQLVAQYQYAHSEQEQGLQTPSRYIRAVHDDPLVDVDNGRGYDHHSVYLGANLHLCPDQLKWMAGVSYDWMATRDGGHFSATTWQTAVRISF